MVLYITDVVLDGTVMTVHFAFNPQSFARKGAEKDSVGGLYDTDLLRRYKAYADEKVCPFPRRSPREDEKTREWGFW
jgi:hypothetical protein